MMTAEVMRSVADGAVVERVGWVLVHSVWEAAVVAIVVALVLTLMRTASAGTRYVVGCVGMGVVAGVVAGTFVFVRPAERMVVPAARPLAPVVRPEVARPRVEIADDGPRAKEVRAYERAAGVVRPALPWAVGAWAVGVVVLGVWQVGGWVAVRRLARRTRAVSREWEERAAKLAGQMGLRKAVRLAESAVASVPAVVGFWRPVVLVPVACLSGMPARQLEAILLHELAHVRRQDYLVNLTQVVVETLLFYHPAVRWLGRQIRVEREHCCDDIAAKACGDRVAYARALAALEEMRGEGRGAVIAARLAMGAADGALLRRVRRVLGLPAAGREKRRTPMLAGVVASMACVVGPVAWMSVGGKAGEAKAAERGATTRPGGHETREFQLRRSRAAVAGKVVEAALSRDGRAGVSADERTNSLLVTGSAGDVEVAEVIVKALEGEPEQAADVPGLSNLPVAGRLFDKGSEAGAPPGPTDEELAGWDPRMADLLKQRDEAASELEHVGQMMLGPNNPRVVTARQNLETIEARIKAHGDAFRRNNDYRRMAEPAPIVPAPAAPAVSAAPQAEADPIEELELKRLELIANSPAKIQLAKAMLQAKQAELARTQQLAKQNVGSQSDLERAKTEVLQAQAQLQLAEEEQQEAKIRAQQQRLRVEGAKGGGVPQRSVTPAQPDAPAVPVPAGPAGRGQATAPADEEGQRDAARQLFNQGIDAESRQHWVEAAWCYEQIRRQFPLGAWPAGLDVRLAVVREALAAQTTREIHSHSVGQAGTPLRFVRVVVNKNGEVSFDGKRTNWEGLAEQLKDLPDARQAVLELATASDDVPVGVFYEANAKANDLVKRLGMKNLSVVGTDRGGTKR